MTEDSQIRRLEWSGTQRRYDGNLSDHHHLRCLICGEVEDVAVGPGRTGRGLARETPTRSSAIDWSSPESAPPAGQGRQRRPEKTDFARPRKRGWSSSRPSSKRRPTRKKNTPSVCLNCWRRKVEIQAGFPAGVIGTTAENLEEAAGGRKLRMDRDVSLLRPEGPGRGV